MNEVQEALTRIHNIEHKLDIILTKLRLTDLADEGDQEAGRIAKLPPTPPQEPRPPCPVCNQPIQMQVIQMTPSQMFTKDGQPFFGYKRICGCKISSVKL